MEHNVRIECRSIILEHLFYTNIPILQNHIPFQHFTPFQCSLSLKLPTNSVFHSIWNAIYFNSRFQHFIRKFHDNILHQTFVPTLFANIQSHTIPFQHYIQIFCSNIPFKDSITFQHSTTYQHFVWTFHSINPFPHFKNCIWKLPFIQIFKYK